MKYILWIFISTIIFSQSTKYFNYYGSGNSLKYDGDELITNEIDRTFEPASVLYLSNFSGGTDGWASISGCTVTGNIDGIYGYDNVLRMNLTGGQSRTRRVLATTIGLVYIASVETFVPTASSVDNIFYNGYSGAGTWIYPFTPTKNVWEKHSLIVISEDNIDNGFSAYSDNGSSGDSIYVKNYSVGQVASFYPKSVIANHQLDTTSSIKNDGSYAEIIMATGAGDNSANYISLDSLRFTEPTAGLNYRFQIYAYTVTNGVTMTFEMGDIMKTKSVSTTSMGAINFDFKATASTYADIKIYLNKSASVYIDSASLKEGG